MKPKVPVVPSLRDAPSRAAIVARQCAWRLILLIVVALTLGGAVGISTAPLRDPTFAFVQGVAWSVGWGTLGIATGLLISDRWTLAWEIGEKEIGQLMGLLEDSEPGQREIERYRNQVLSMGREFTRFDLSILQGFNTEAWTHNVALRTYRQYVEAHDRLYGAPVVNGSSTTEEGPQSMS
ncbi:hypothetical protein [Burkholderia anthina]|uniref:hypothetical protein n=1 Tax=Burkholderia anthina TaxID=179879 RepID=UPI0037C07C1E